MPRRTLSILLLLAALAAPARADEPRVSDGLKPFVDRGVLAGAVVLVASPEKVLALESVGYSDAAAKVPITRIRPAGCSRRPMTSGPSAG